MNTIRTKWCHCLKTVFLQARIGVLLAGIFCSAVSLGGTIYYYVGASNVWNTAQAYSLTSGGEGGAGIPGQEDSIRIAKDQVVYLDDASIGFLNGVKEVDFREEGSVVYIHLDNDFSLNCWFGDLGSRVSGAVDIVKTGVGKLTFAKCGTTAHATTADCYNYNIGLDIREGSIQLEPTYASNYRHHYKDVKISSGATLFGSRTLDRPRSFGRIKASTPPRCFRGFCRDMRCSPLPDTLTILGPTVPSEVLCFNHSITRGRGTAA